MSWHWSYRSFPKFANVDPEVRDRVWKRCLARANRDPLTWLVWSGLAAAGPATVGVQHLFTWLGAGDEGSLVAVAAFGLGVAWSLPRAWAGVARRYIRSDLPGHCRHCGYDLAGNTSGVCPECGTATAKGAP